MTRKFNGSKLQHPKNRQEHDLLSTPWYGLGFERVPSQKPHLCTPYAAVWEDGKARNRTLARLSGATTLDKFWEGDSSSAASQRRCAGYSSAKETSQLRYISRVP
ncbi:hypothetical protein [Ferrithrix thermotolerans]|uniref:hypothetical protein n=1 Tax=Ferrithrix thermotolerans TaxID=209649 RepID=UPI0011601ED7|nr:hypothetical protein [Ferrithrix thermotolerans]